MNRLKANGKTVKAAQSLAKSQGGAGAGFGGFFFAIAW